MTCCAKQPPPAPGSRLAVFLLSAALAIAVVAVVIMASLYRQADADKTDAEDAVTATQAELAEATESVAENEEVIEELEAEVVGQAEELDDARSQLEETRADLESATQELADREDLLAAAEADTAANAEIIIEVLALSMISGGGLDEDAARCFAESLVESRGPGVLVTFIEVGMTGPEMSVELAEIGVEMLRVGE